MNWSSLGTWLVLLVLCTGQSLTGEIKLGIVQWGDTYGMFESMLKDDLPKDCIAGQQCVGGIPLLMGYIQDIKTHYFSDVHPDKQLSIVTGNLVSGENGLLSLLGWDTYGRMLKGIPECCTPKDYEPVVLYTPDYMSLGIKEFEAGLAQTNDYLTASTIAGGRTKTVITNVQKTETKDIQINRFHSLTQRHQVYKVNNEVSIGIVGFINPLVNKLGDAGGVIFDDDPVVAIQQELVQDELKSVKFVIAVGTGTYEMAQSIIDRVGDKVKLVIYGGGTKNLTGNYPVKYGNSYIATTGSKYATRIGAIKLTLDAANGDLLNVDGNLREVSEGTAIVANEKAITEFSNFTMKSGGNRELVPTRVKLDGSICWNNECNLGNLVTDAMVHCAHNSKNDSSIITALEGPIISVWHGGALFANSVEPRQKVHVIDVHKWLPYHNRAYLVQILGSTLKQLFITSSEGLQENPTHKWGQFLQVSSGMEITYDNQELVRIRTDHLENGIPRLREIEDDKEYNVVVPSFIYKKKSVWDYMTDDKFIPFTNGKKFIDIGFDDDCLQKFVEASGVISTGFDERIYLSKEETPSDGSWGGCSSNTGLTVFLTLFITAIIFGLGFACWHFVIAPRRANGNCF